jgi:hypothetical protein
LGDSGSPVDSATPLDGGTPVDSGTHCIIVVPLYGGPSVPPCPWDSGTD